MKIKAYGNTDKGLVRTGNEDYLHLDPENHVYAVCDGMGGHQAGEVASMTASEVLKAVFSSFRNKIYADQRLSTGHILPDNADILLKATRLANRAISKKADENSEFAGMGTTIVSLTFDFDLMSVVHVGDSRAYRIDDDKLTPLTTDHSWVAEIQKAQNLSEEEASSMVGKNIITRALGVRNTVEVDCQIVKVEPGQRFLLCSDGLCGYADDDEIFMTVKKVHSDNDKIVSSLIQMANDRGGADNVTIAVVEVESVTSSELGETAVFTLGEESEELLAIENEWVEKILGTDDKKKDENTVEDIDAVKPSSKLPLIIIFCAFVIVAIIIIVLFK